MKKVKTFICKKCGTIGKPKSVCPGSIWIELILWLCYIFPGVIYSIWRNSKKHSVCSVCGSDDIIGTGTPIGSQLVKKMKDSHPT